MMNEITECALKVSHSCQVSKCNLDGTSSIKIPEHIRNPMTSFFLQKTDVQDVFLHFFKIAGIFMTHFLLNILT